MSSKGGGRNNPAGKNQYSTHKGTVVVSSGRSAVTTGDRKPKGLAPSKNMTSVQRAGLSTAGKIRTTKDSPAVTPAKATPAEQPPPKVRSGGETRRSFVDATSLTPSQQAAARAKNPALVLRDKVDTLEMLSRLPPNYVTPEIRKVKEQLRREIASLQKQVRG
jgi:hypothetical protein